MNESSQFEDLKSLLFGEALGIGIHRKVGVFNPDPTLVIKCAIDCPNINVLEEEIWMMVKDTDIAKWFAPCVSISPGGIFLLQKRAERRPRSEYPKEIPAFFTDTKYSNFGWIDGRFVCVDYASFISTSMSHKWSKKMKKADFWE
jgi:hypothetical protein